MKLYKYHGQISGFHGTVTGTEITLYDPQDENKAPTRLYACNSLIAYLNRVSSSDLEEKYMETDYFYDDLLYLRRIEIPSSDPLIPAKIIAQAGKWGDEAVIFGPKEYIACEHSEPMNVDEWNRWLRWRYDNLEVCSEACNSEIKVIDIAGVVEQFKCPRKGETAPQEYARERDNVLSVWKQLYKWITGPGNWDAYVRANEVCAVLERALDLKDKEI